MHRLWFITNPRSKIATREKCDAIEAVIAERGLELAGRTRFPDDTVPEPATLAAERVDTVVLFAGDGTINTALCRLASGDGAFLILPGGTMNLLAKRLHDSLDPHVIVAAAHEANRRVSLPYVEAGPHRAFVGLVIGPASNWYRAREAVRAHQLMRMVGAIRYAWRRTFGGSVKVNGAPRLRRGYQAVYVTPGDSGQAGLRVTAINARDW